MHFRLSRSTDRPSLHPDGVDPLVFSMRKAHDLRVSISNVENDENVRLECLVETEFEPTSGILEAFEALASERLPEGHLPREQWTKDHDYIDHDGSIRDNHVVPMYLMPEGFQTFADQLSCELYEAGNDAFGVLRWRSRSLGLPRPFSTRRVEWSLDGNEWHRMPTTGTLEIVESDRLEVSETAASEMQDFLNAGDLEPLAHVLFREAWSQRRANPRSSLLIAMTALEVGVKQYISACLPAATWLAENAPTPPVLAMLRGYLPTLDPPDERPRLEPFDQEILDTVKVAVAIRNGLAHRGADVPRDRLMQTLRAVRNVLWALDAALGHEWAAEHHFPSLDEDLPTGYRKV